MGRSARELFFARWSESLQPLEIQLRDALLAAAGFAAELLPDDVPLQAWVDQRIPGTVLLGTDLDGFVLLLPDVVAEGEFAAPLSPSPSPPPSRPPAVRPRPQLTPSVTARPHVTVRPVVATRPPAAIKYGKSTVKDEVGNKGNGKGKDTGKGKERGLRRSEERDQFVEEFFFSLPEDVFSEEEDALRTALLDFLNNWRGHAAPSLSAAGSDEAVRAARLGLLPHAAKGISIGLGQWLERRMAGEIEIGRSGRETFFGRARDDSGKVALAIGCVEDGGGVAPRSDEMCFREFFESLPCDGLLPAEIALRDYLVHFAHSWTGPSPSPRLADASCGGLRNAFIPKRIPLAQWIERRVSELDTFCIGLGGSPATFFDEKGFLDKGANEAFVRAGEDGQPAKKRRLPLLQQEATVFF